MIKDIRTQYKAEEILASIPFDRGELFIGYRPVVASGTWNEQFHQVFDRQPGRRLSRSVFEITGNTKGGIVVEVAECASVRDAVEDLMDVLDENELAALDPGPEFLQPAAFRHPQQAPDAVFFARANLRISIIAQSRNDKGVDEWLERIQRDLNLEPEEARDSLEILSSASRENTVLLNYRLPWKVGSEGWFKFVSEGTSIERGTKPDELVIGKTGSGITVRGWVLEPGRESYKGKFENMK